ncbi:hypothetical protein C0J50_18617 [Silurus asotus]|uniref:Uncharacterized protein n=1 Tax=Silurus asotus TaxID=30991 RepID=A0AAD5ATG7_SILAS|nr:hypothetical protein C0J50_18617 [Silurus asotus]
MMLSVSFETIGVNWFYSDHMRYHVRYFIMDSKSKNSQCRRSGSITARRIGVPDLDQRFNDFADTFNKQQENYERMRGTLRNLESRYLCDPGSGLSECLRKIKDLYDDHRISLQMKGYDFNLIVIPNDPVPDSLELTQENVKELCRAATAIVAVGPKLEEMIDWLLKSEESLAQNVNKAAKTHQETKRLESNFRENLREASRAKELSPRYRKEAQKLFKEVALLSGVQT